MKILNLCFVLSVFLLTGCSVLSESQVKNINAFAVTAKHYSYFPHEVFKKRAQLHLNNELLEASQFTDPNIIARTVSNARAHYKAAMQLSDKFDLSLKLLQQYAELLVKLSSDKYNEDLNTNTAGLNANLTALFATYNSKAQTPLPAGLGAHIADIVLLAGKRITKSRQASELKKFIPEANVLIQATTNNLVQVLDSDTFIGTDGTTYNSLKSLLFKENQNFLTNYKNVVLANTQQNGNKVSYGSITTYSNTLFNFENTEALRQKTVEAARQLALAHAELTKEIERKKTLTEIKQEIQDLITDVQTLAGIVSDFKSETVTIDN